ncbi:T9SS type B sorting domain-containing protein [Portibacter marinus]|uniref:T9SS type B sorting domain-containing protein n=1 Tax=Portibacter marinus TaxID=2898660 RepID=UPI001F35DB0F|nr:gliding motility-associated C-terminal domain-containing protein [Portibacter marinus]
MNWLKTILIFVVFHTQSGLAQEFLPDGGFETIVNDNCINPKNGFNETVFWYAIQGTPDLFTSDCPLPVTNEVFWTDGSQAGEGSNFVGLRCRVNANQTYVSEGLATELSEPLESNTAYFVLLKVRSKGFYQGFPTSVISCPLKPDKKIEIYTHTDSIKVENDFSNGTSTSNGDLIGVLRSEVLTTDQVLEEWTTIGTCIKPDVTSQYFSLSMPIGNFGTFPPCAADDTQGTFYSFYFEMDEVQIIKLPKRLDTITYLNDNAPLDVYLPEFFEIEYLKDVEYKWTDGFVGSNRSISTEGNYIIQAVLACGSIELHLEVLREDGALPIYIPSAFSPNDDGINDRFTLYPSPEIAIDEFDLQIFDRWGNQVFKSKHIEDSWNGRMLSSALGTGEYIYVLNCLITGKSGTTRHRKSGSLAIIR